MIEHLKDHFAAASARTVEQQQTVSKHSSHVNALASEILPIVKKQSMNVLTLQRALASLPAIERDMVKARLQTQRAILHLTALRELLPERSQSRLPTLKTWMTHKAAMSMPPKPAKKR